PRPGSWRTSKTWSGWSSETGPGSRRECAPWNWARYTCSTPTAQRCPEAPPGAGGERGRAARSPSAQGVRQGGGVEVGSAQTAHRVADEQVFRGRQIGGAEAPLDDTPAGDLRIPDRPRQQSAVSRRRPPAPPEPQREMGPGGLG